MLDDIIYLDHAAATPIDRRVFASMEPYFGELFYNPSSPYKQAVAVRRDYESARATIAQAIGAKPGEIIMTAGATESINLAFSAASGHAVTSAIEHDSVLAAAKRHDHTIIAVGESGIAAAADVQAAVTDKTTIISVALANNELGTIQPISALAEIVAEVRRTRLHQGNKTPLYLHTDASQGVGQLDIQVARLGVDMMSLNAGKVYGPKQVGLLWIKPSVVVEPQIVGGGQEGGLRSGTENVAGVVGFATALRQASEKRKSETARLQKLRDYLQKQLVEAFPDAVLSGNSKRRLSGHLHISFPGVDAERLVFMLENDNVMVATGSACAANKDTRSHVLEAIGLDPAVIDGSLRLTLGRLSTEANTKLAADKIKQAVSLEMKRSRGQA
ncbi:MAG: cysteine desulfurase [bacterium]|nr:cysteine desulfurase [bacterium]MDN5835614.1 cysteine desulfurase [bacterium]